MRKLYFLVGFLLFLNSCETGTGEITTGTKGTTGTKIQSNASQGTNKKRCKNLLVIAEDRSGSTSDHRKLKANDYRNIFKSFQKKFFGEIAVRVIGNPAPEEREFYLLDIEPFKEHLKIDDDMLMSEKGQIIAKNKEIDKENSTIEEKNNEKTDAFIKEKIEPHIINYKPYKKRDITDVQDALQHIQDKVDEPTFSDFDHIQVLIISDGKHDASKLKNGLTFKPNRPIELYLIGWKDRSVFKDLHPNTFESVDGFIEYYKKSTCK